MTITRQFRLIFLIILTFVLVSPCYATAEPDHDVEAEVYAAYINHFAKDLPSNKSLVIKPTTVLLYNLFSGDDPLFEIGPRIPSATESVISSFLNVGSSSVLLSIPPHLVSPGIRYSIASERTLRKTFDNKFEDKAWKIFYRTHPSAVGLFSFSRIGFDVEGKQALFYVEYSCGILCGDGYLVLVQFQSGQWKVIVNEHLYVT